MSSEKDKVYDVIGVGFGPANLCLAVVLEDAEESAQLDRLFLESKPNFVWHPNMLIEDSLLQLSAIKDLITPVNPRSQYTFLNYLKEKDRIYEFLNLRDLFPTRIEYNDYMTWVAEQLDDKVRYGCDVQQIVAVDDERKPVAHGGPATLLRIEAKDAATGQTEHYYTRNVVVATGGKPTLPEGVEIPPNAPVLNPGCFLDAMQRFDEREKPYRFVVVGSGQSAGEIFEYLLDHYPNADVTATIRSFAYKPVDESSFTNQIFFPSSVDYFYGLPAEKRRSFLKKLCDTNYAVIDYEIIRRIYQRLYRQRVLGRERARVMPFLELTGLAEGPGGRVITKFHNLMDDETHEIEADGAVLCTGFSWPKEHPILDTLAPYFDHDDLEGYKVERDYGIAAREGFGPRVFLQGYCEDTHGIGETVLSLQPARAKDIEKSLLESRAAWRAAPAIAAVS